MAAAGRLTLAYVSDLCDGADVREVKKIDASKRGLTKTVDLSVCIELLKLDLSGNALCSVSGIIDCRSLTWLNLSHNNLESIQGVQRLTNLAVLNASHNSISVCVDLSPLKKLKALVLSHNQLSILPGLHSLTELNSLVLSGNHIEAVQIKTLSKLEKVSLSHNQLREIPDTSGNPELRELRLNDNKISSVPPTLSQNGKLQLLDVGRNRVHQWTALAPLQHLMRLRNLNLQGNRICSEEGYMAKVSALVPRVQVLDNQRLLQKKLEQTPAEVAPPPPTTPTDTAPPPKKKAKLVTTSASGADKPVSLTTADTASKSSKKVVKTALLPKTKTKKWTGKKQKLAAPGSPPLCTPELEGQAVEEHGGSCDGVNPVPAGHCGPLGSEHAPTVETTAEQSTLPRSAKQHVKGGTVLRLKARKEKQFGRNSGVVRVKEVRRRRQSKRRKAPTSPSEFVSTTFNSWF